MASEKQVTFIQSLLGETVAASKVNMHGALAWKAAFLNIPDTRDGREQAAAIYTAMHAALRSFDWAAVDTKTASGVIDTLKLNGNRQVSLVLVYLRTFGNEAAQAIAHEVV